MPIQLEGRKKSLRAFVRQVRALHLKYLSRLSSVCWLDNFSTCTCGRNIMHTSLGERNEALIQRSILVPIYQYFFKYFDFLSSGKCDRSLCNRMTQVVFVWPLRWALSIQRWNGYLHSCIVCIKNLFITSIISLQEMLQSTRELFLISVSSTEKHSQ